MAYVPQGGYGRGGPSRIPLGHTEPRTTFDEQIRHRFTKAGPGLEEQLVVLFTMKMLSESKASLSLNSEKRRCA